MNKYSSIIIPTTTSFPSLEDIYNNAPETINGLVKRFIVSINDSQISTLLQFIRSLSDCTCLTSDGNILTLGTLHQWDTTKDLTDRFGMKYRWILVYANQSIAINLNLGMNVTSQLIVAQDVYIGDGRYSWLAGSISNSSTREMPNYILRSIKSSERCILDFSATLRGNFNRCYSLREVVLPRREGAGQIPPYYFYDTTSLEKLHIRNHIGKSTTTESWLMYSTSLRSFMVSQGYSGTNLLILSTRNASYSTNANESNLNHISMSEFNKFADALGNSQNGIIRIEPKLNNNLRLNEYHHILQKITSKGWSVRT